jgi:hypothetical protein
MTTHADVKAAKEMDRLFGHDVQSITVEGTKYYLVHTLFRHFGILPSESFKRNYCKRFPGLYQFVITYDRLHAYCNETRVKRKARLMLCIGKHEQPVLELADTVQPKHVNEGAIAIPDTATLEAGKLMEVVEALGIGRVYTILKDKGVLKDLCIGKDEGRPRTIRITVEY